MFIHVETCQSASGWLLSFKLSDWMSAKADAGHCQVTDRLGGVIPGEKLFSRDLAMDRSLAKPVRLAWNSDVTIPVSL